MGVDKVHIFQLLEVYYEFVHEYSVYKSDFLMCQALSQ